MKKSDWKWLWFAALATLIVLFWRARERSEMQRVTHSLSGSTMGTSWQVQLADLSAAVDEKWLMGNLERDVVTRLQEINGSMSTWDPVSLISLINGAPADSIVEVDADFRSVFELALEIQSLSSGYFDPAIAPLINLWGFGVEDRQDAPTPEELSQTMAVCGLEQFHWTAGPTGAFISKAHGENRLDFSAIAKGWAVDQLALLLEKHGARNYCVEIGGEVRTSGSPSGALSWHIGIQRPLEGASVTSADWISVLAITESAMATSGTYRNFRKFRDANLPHIISPRSGRPISSSTVSVTVTARDCGTADALATALMIMGPDRGRALLEQLPGTEALFVVEADDGELKQILTAGMEKMVRRKP